MFDCKMASIGDIHFGSPSNDTPAIIRAAKKYLIEDGLIAKIDILFFDGDIFDRLLDLDHDDAGEIDLFFASTIREAARHKTKIRLLRGTFSHDHDQVERFMTVAKLIKSDIDIKYFNTLDIEYIQDFDCHVLYVPDHWTPTTAETLQQVKDLLKARGLVAVDLAIMHGHMDFQVPKEIKTIPCHDSAEYEKLVMFQTFIGHEHKHSRKGNIFAPGSFDRLTHGQEEPKGFAYCEIVSNVATAWFIENKMARIYKTVDCEGLSLEDAIAHVKKEVALLPDDSCVRVVAQSRHPLFGNMSELSSMFPLLVWSKKGKEEDEEFVRKETGQLLDDGSPEWIPVHIEKSNVVGLLLDRLKAHALSEVELDYIERQLEELK